MRLTFPPKLRRGDTIRVVAPSVSLAGLDTSYQHLIERRFAELGLTLTYGEHVRERDAFDSSSVASRVADLHAAFADPGIAGVLTVIGGFNSNQLLPHLDFDLIAANPKVFCGYSDITVLQAAMLARAGLVTYFQGSSVHSGRTGYSSQLTSQQRDPDAAANLWRPVPGDHGARGAFDDRAHARSVQLPLSLHRSWTVGGGLLAGLAGASAVRRRRR